MKTDRAFFMFWTIAILGVATAIILYQHAVHTGIVLQTAGAAGNLGAAPQASGTISSNPINSGAASRASGQWGPLGPNLASIMPYMPGQAFQ